MRPTIAERRRALRLACALIVHYKAGPTWHPASALDLSEGGCRVRIGEDLGFGSPVRLRFELAIRDGMTASSAELEGMVAWCRREGLSHQAGIRFSAAPGVLEPILEALQDA
jgi:hypothetical protein